MKTQVEPNKMTALIRIRRLWRVMLASAAMVYGLIWPVAQAADIPSLEQTVTLNAREQPVDLFFTELFGQVGVPAKVDDAIVGSVNGDFQQPATEIVDQITSAFQLAVYYDGAVAHIYPANDISRKVLYMSTSAAKSVTRAAEKLGMTDSRNTLSVTDVGLVVTGARRYIEQIDRLANAVSKKTSKPVQTHETYQIFQLKYAWADDVSLSFGGETVVIPGVATLIRALIEPGAFGAPTVTRTPGSSSRDGLRGQGLSSQGMQEVNDKTGSVNPPAGVSQADIAGLSSSSGGSTARTRIVADPLSNSVIIRDKADRMSVYESLINSLDKEPQMIEIEATIIDLDTDKLRELGVNWRLNRNDDQALLGNGTATDELLRPGTEITPSGQGGIVSLVLGSQQQFLARIRALETQGAARIVSKPHVMTLSNVEALLDTTSTFFVRVAGQEEVDLFDVKVGTRLRVTPHVHEQGGRSQIKMRVNIVDGTTSEQQQVDGIPVVEESTINTQAIIDVGQSLLIGGLVRELKGNGVTRVPVLGRIPGLGALFRTTTKTSSRQERMFLLTPRLSAPAVPGKRYSAPVLSGSESDIITSAGTRMNTSRQALSLLDETHPIEQPLPRGEGLTTSTSLVQPYHSVAPEDTVDDEIADQPQPPSLRDRLLRGDQPATTTPSPGQQLISDAPREPVSPSQQWQAWQSDEQWQIASAPPEVDKILNSSEPVTEEDNWQAVGSTAEAQPVVSRVETPVTAVQIRQRPSVAPAQRPLTEPSQAASPAPAIDDDGWQVIAQ
ncbi:MAG: type III secretion system outer membrane ring subunit SctC [Granulosicoccus sp.]|nr:type III secretion system outer membrane ring subunit SctC [Granulosicoccus sp.]